MRKIVSLFILSVMLMGIGLTVNAREQKGEEISREEYGSREREYKEQMKKLLEEYGIKNPGIMLVYVVDEDREREYTLSLHHRMLSKLKAEEVAAMKMRMKEWEGLLGDGTIKWEINQYKE